MTEDEMASLRGEWREGEKERWHHWFNGHEFELALGDDKGCVAVYGVIKSRTQLSDCTSDIFFISELCKPS